MSVNQELSALVQRLEVVASRLEKAHGGGDSKQVVSELVALVKQSTTSSIPTASLAKAIENLEILADKRNGAGNNEGEASASVQAFEQILSGPFKTYTELSRKIGGDVATHGVMVESAFKAQRDYLALAAKSKKPDDNDLPELLNPTSNKIGEIQEFREKNRRSQYFNHLSSISESIPALGWVAVSPAPAPYVKEMNDAGQFYTNRVLKDWKEKSKVHVEWTRSWVSTLSELQAFVKQYHTTGLVWNPKGGVAKIEAKPDSNGSAPAGPPPPPPPPPPGLFDDISAAESSDPKDQARNALFADLNKGSDVTKGLKKVTADMQTHKNPNLRKGGVVPDVKGKSPPAVAPKPAAFANKPPKFELEGKKWMVEFQQKNPSLVISNTEVNQSVYIYRCEGSTVKVNGKINNIIMDSCKKCAVVFDSVLSSCEFVNCQSVQMQGMGSVPTISVEKTDGCQMFLSKESADKVEIISAKSSEMNVMIPTGDEYVEQAIPEQFKTTIKGTKLTTNATDSI